MFRVSSFEFRISDFLLCVVVALFVVPAPAHAHLMNTGFGPFYDGLTHLFVTPEDLLPAVALTLLGGLGGSRCGRVVLFALPSAWLAGSLGGFLVAPQLAPPAAIAALATVALGALVAADMRLPLALVGGAAIVLGLMNGGVNGIELAKTHSSSLTAAGVACALFVVVALLAGHTASLRTQWARVVVRVAGSWIGAIGLFMLGWALRAT